jgi:hypothetical protein
MPSLIGNKPNQVPTNSDLGILAFQDTPMVQVPASATAPGSPGQLAHDGTYLYVCTAANTWKRVELLTW